MKECVMIQSKTDISDPITHFNNPYEALEHLMVIVSSSNRLYCYCTRAESQI